MRCAELIDPFDTLLGNTRGERQPLHLSAAGRDRVQHLADTEGLDGALRALGLHRRTALRDEGLARVLSDIALDDVYAKHRPVLSAWLRAVAVRPYWALHFLVQENTVHFYPDGDAYADSADVGDGDRSAPEFLHPSLLTAACGAAPNSGLLLLNRGCIASIAAAQNPASPKLCERCWTLHATHHEAAARDETDLLPAPQLTTTLASWRSRARERAVAALADGVSAEALHRTVAAGLNAAALTWAAQTTARNPRACALRALRSNGASIPYMSFHCDLPAKAQAIAALNLDAGAWEAELRPHQRAFMAGSHAGPGPAAAAWAGRLLLLVPAA